MIDFERFYEENFNKAIGYTRKKVTNPQDAEDLVMDAFAACYQNLERFDESRASLGTWFFVALNNRIKNHYRDTKVTEELDIEIPGEGSFEDELVAAELLSAMRQDLAEALKQLNEVQRKIIILTYFKNKKSTEVAAVMQMTDGNVRQQLRRARIALHNYFVTNNIQWEE